MKKILLIEDDSITRTILKTLLSSEYEVFEAKSAEDGLELYKNSDLIICDFHLPGMSGLQFA
jgi:CheY-like chemotaxis protein